MSQKERASVLSQDYLADLWSEFQDCFESEEVFRRTVALWPICPNCGKRRAVRCPVCGRVGDLCPPADEEFWDGVDEAPGLLSYPDNDKSESVNICSCTHCDGSGKSEPKSVSEESISSNSPFSLSLNDNDSSAETNTDLRGMTSKPDIRENSGVHEPAQKTVWQITGLKEQPDEEHFTAASDSIFTAKTFSVSSPHYHRSSMVTLDMSPEKETATTEKLSRKFSKPGLPLVLCPTCDEPFVPKYLSSCRNCGFLFDKSAGSISGDENEIDPYEEPPALRVMLAAGGLIIVTALLLLFLVYFVK